MTEQFKMDAPATARRLDDMAQGLVGAPLDRPEGPLKVSGTATYANEWQVEGMVHGVMVRAPGNSGRVVLANREAVAQMPGVLAVIQDPRLLRNPAQGTANQAPIQGPEQAAYLGQLIAVVVAEEFEQARHAAQSLKVALENGEVMPVDPATAAVEPQEAKTLDQGDLDGAMAQAAFSVDVTYTTPSHSSTPMEPHASIASWDGEELTLRGSYQMLKYNRNELSDALGIHPDRLRILSPYVGGGFGSKLGIAPEAVAAAIAAKEVGRPVSVALHRQQVYEATMRRSETTQRVRLAADAEGRLTGLGHDARVSNLPGESFAEPVLQASHFLYAGANRKMSMDLARVHRLCAGSVRAPGEAVGVTVFEGAMDELADKVGMDPVELRRRNIPEKDPESGKEFSSRRFREALDSGAETFGWADRPGVKERREGEWLIGYGMASAARVNVLMESQARVTLMPDGRLRVETDMTDIGTGTYAILGQIAGDMMGLPRDAVDVVLGDTTLPPASGSGGSWGASSSGTSVYLACEAIRKQLAARLEVEEGDLTLKDGMATFDNQTRSLSDILNGDEIAKVGHVQPGDTSEAVRQATFGAYFAEVAVHAASGETRVRRMHGTFAAGRILNAKTARSQCLGGMTFGIGIALTEELAFDPRDGHVANHNLAEYHIPVNADVPQLTVDLLEERDDWANPLQAKGIGELGICGAAAAITNAIYNATGVRVRDYPATLDKVIAGM
ncbi:xanthine dehydrogenase family protein molybdopterin-binding subunit [Sulfitobacter sp. KE29]|uniref:xanthine dehydrogenase family protein molybdopterin-binding subunit n=1 Tax=unclassified Sulfitobacter TaxID=196795 RepID=UPI0007C3BD07|nr:MULTISPECIES: xanthine dehydrogenase family protein molybdopterin-binding subunit [unclassified Sulfitobacter]KZY52352.1 xanthine dehydrogenase [Sulfitobacter sp. HI0054]MBO9438937.1 xanthine dehydrogenase family protein molybdopterin-binding subunit [Sulfitobacter sp. R18_2]MDF3419414.1 xanthine dehydrogenase family protein molybdopterin-binding subunit [Sulfitobacter sp. Ks38]MDF3426913.1 xanthine dehydrogenase family protein molybdopterin-binding subunit [Sulfitobacter sp. KE29]MDF343048